MAQSAAAKVFATPELLEHILLDYAKDSAHYLHQSIYKCASLESPVTALYVWQRIDKTTRNIIMGSTKLRRFMFIDPVQEGSEEDLDIRLGMAGFSCERRIVTPALWLADISRKHFLSGQRIDECHGSTESGFFKLALTEFYVTWNVSYEAEILLGKAMRRPEASWRSIPVRHVSNIEQPISIELHFDLEWVGWYKEEFDVEKETTLGEFFDWYTTAVERSLCHHRKILKNLIKYGDEKGSIHDGWARWSAGGCYRTGGIAPWLEESGTDNDSSDDE